MIKLVYTLPKEKISFFPYKSNTNKTALNFLGQFYLIENIFKSSSVNLMFKFLT